MQNELSEDINNKNIRAVCKNDLEQCVEVIRSSFKRLQMNLDLRKKRLQDLQHLRLLCSVYYTIMSRRKDQCLHIGRMNKLLDIIRF